MLLLILLPTANVRTSAKRRTRRHRSPHNHNLPNVTHTAHYISIIIIICTEAQTGARRALDALGTEQIQST